jgi:hypothetical protein
MSIYARRELHCVQADCLILTEMESRSAGWSYGIERTKTWSCGSWPGTPKISTRYLWGMQKAHNPISGIQTRWQEPPIVQLQLGEGFKLEHVPGSNEPFLSYHIVEFVPTTYTRDALEEAIEDLFSGQDPAGGFEGFGELARVTTLQLPQLSHLRPLLLYARVGL